MNLSVILIPLKLLWTETLVDLKGLALWKCQNDEEASKAIEALNDTTLDGREIVVKKANPPGGGGGGRGRGGYGGGGGGRGRGGYGGGGGGGGGGYRDRGNRY